MLSGLQPSQGFARSTTNCQIAMSEGEGGYFSAQLLCMLLLPQALCLSCTSMLLPLILYHKSDQQDVLLVWCPSALLSPNLEAVSLDFQSHLIPQPCGVISLLSGCLLNICTHLGSDVESLQIAGTEKVKLLSWYVWLCSVRTICLISLLGSICAGVCVF